MIDDKTGDGDTVLEKNGARVFVDATTASKLEGAELGFISDERGEGFAIGFPGGAPAGGGWLLAGAVPAAALLALLHAGEAAHPAVTRGVQFLLSTQCSDGFWEEAEFTGTGFPRVFYLRYHGYRAYFPLWALALYRRCHDQNGVGDDSVVIPLRPPRLPR